MKKDIKANWIKDLQECRSTVFNGKYLHFGDTFSSLGRLTDMFIESPENVGKMMWSRKSGTRIWTFDGSYSYLPKIVEEWSGMTTQDLSLVYHIEGLSHSLLEVSILLQGV